MRHFGILILDESNNQLIRRDFLKDYYKEYNYVYQLTNESKQEFLDKFGKYENISTRQISKEDRKLMISFTKSLSIIREGWNLL